MKVNSEVDRDSMKEAMMPVIQQYLEEQGGGLWEMYQEICALSEADS